jgi:hypothetical protein
VVEDVPPPLPLATPLLLVKPAAGLSTPAVFRALDLAGRSGADPQRLLAALAAGGAGGSPLPSVAGQESFNKGASEPGTRTHSEPGARPRSRWRRRARGW